MANSRNTIRVNKKIGKRPIMKKIGDLITNLYINPDKIFNNECPASRFAASLTPKLTAFAK